ncbi:MAG: hypothetical protein Tsb0013_00690 [Phycisphaerales bacterium]
MASGGNSTATGPGTGDDGGTQRRAQKKTARRSRTGRLEGRKKGSRNPAPRKSGAYVAPSSREPRCGDLYAENLREIAPIPNDLGKARYDADPRRGSPASRDDRPQDPPEHRSEQPR